ncbi:MAG: protein kinase domain-containing protein [Phycisphaerales bacterium]
MNDPNWDGLREAVADALEAPANDRAAALARACGSDVALLGAARGLVELESRRRDFLRPPVPGAAGLALAEAAADGGIDVRFGPYRATAVIAVGGMGTVYRAVRDDDAFERQVAVKVVNPALVAPIGMARFDRERRALARLSHPNIAGLLDGGRTGEGVPYLVMELVEGVRIDEWCRVDGARGAAARRRAELIRVVAEAVHHAHRALVVHRDLKPSNILVTADGTPKLLDFGISRLLDPATDDACATLPGALTPRYAAPEQLRGEPATTAADVFALGVVLYELLAGAPPWGDQAEGSGRPVPRRPSAVDPSVPRDLDAIVLKAMAESPAERYGSAEALAEDLHRFLQGRPVKARVPSAAYRVRKFVRRHRVGTALGAAAAALILGGAGTATWFAVGMAAEQERVHSAWASAERINRILAETLEAADAGAAAGESLSVESLLASAARRLPTEAGDDPAAAGAVHRTLARAYGNLGRHREARPHADAAVEMLRGAHGSEDPRVAEALLDRGQLRLSAGDVSGARTDTEEALRVSRRELAAADPRLAESLGRAARVRLQSGDLTGAESLLREARGLHAERADADARGLAGVLSGLAEVEAAHGRVTEAVRLRREALEAVRRWAGTGSRAEAAAMVGVADALAQAGELDEAEQLVAESTEIVRREAGPGHPTVTYQMMTRASLLERRGRDVEAEQLLAEARRIAGASLATDHYIPMFLALRHGQSLSRLGRYAEALAAFEESYNACVTLLGAEHPNTRKVADDGLKAAEALGTEATAAAWRERARVP